MGLMDYFSRNPYHRVKSKSNYFEEFFVAMLLNIQSDAKLLQTKKHITAIHLNKLILGTIPDAQITTTKQPNHTCDFLKFVHARPVH